ncbi:ketoacyl-ACP synthase III [Streptomonospora sp. S1-112]|uniref:Ketoacyl-ACP synthase III n=1 Tax=Streptomonospora mangrovi TaxID=2883123 RepID=A0A9X3NWN3_9ACTN|nr:ketoacyl-ACP synthase III [Streptomonospora mangrovi]MDA0565656.1 ketoacyl-ACP synthase III [Streptomonospora mangrovi]
MNDTHRPPAQASAPFRGGLGLPVGIAGTGVHIPDQVVTNADLVAHLDTSDAWIRERTGIRERRFLRQGETTSDMCVAAAEAALADAGVGAAALDAVIVSTFTHDQPLPSTALMVKDRIGAHRAIPLDLNQAACAGGVYGMWLAAHLLQNMELDSVLVIGAEALSRCTDPQDRATRVFFGDAAGAVVLRRTRPGHGILAWHADSRLSHAVEIPAGGSRRPASAETVADRAHFLKMDGRVVWKEATEHLPASVEEVVAAAGVRVADVDRFVFHQANLNIVREAMLALGQPMDKAAVSVDRLGNTGAATVFVGLHESLAQGRVRSGDLVVVSAIGAGFLWGSLCIRHWAGAGASADEGAEASAEAGAEASAEAGAADGASGAEG